MNTTTEAGERVSSKAATAPTSASGMVNRITNAIAHFIGASNVSEPRHMVLSQLNTFTPVGTEISSVANMK